MCKHHRNGGTDGVNSIKERVGFFCYSLHTIPAAACTKECKEERHKWMSDQQSLWVCRNQSEKPSSSWGAGGESNASYWTSLKDARLMLNTSLNIKQIQTVQSVPDKLPSILTQHFKDFFILFFFQKGVDHFISNHPSWKQNKKYRSSAKFTQSGYSAILFTPQYQTDIKQ